MAARSACHNDMKLVEAEGGLSGAVSRTTVPSCISAKRYVAAACRDPAGVNKDYIASRHAIAAKTVMPLILPPCGVRSGKALRPRASVNIDQLLQISDVVTMNNLEVCPVVIVRNRFAMSARTASAVCPVLTATESPLISVAMNCASVVTATALRSSRPINCVAAGKHDCFGSRSLYQSRSRLRLPRVGGRGADRNIVASYFA
jgi:hypothetical protein